VEQTGGAILCRALIEENRNQDYTDSTSFIEFMLRALLEAIDSDQGSDQVKKLLDSSATGCFRRWNSCATLPGIIHN
jgi:hypothetical protein